jgi:hypothetical protein
MANDEIIPNSNDREHNKQTISKMSGKDNSWNCLIKRRRIEDPASADTPPHIDAG